MIPLWTILSSPLDACGCAFFFDGLPCVAQRVWATPQYNTRDLTSSFGSRFREQRATHCILESLLVYSFALVHSIDTHHKEASWIWTHDDVFRTTTILQYFSEKRINWRNYCEDWWDSQYFRMCFREKIVEHVSRDRLKDVQRRRKRNHRSSLGKRPNLDRSMMWEVHQRRRPRKKEEHFVNL